MSESAAKYVTVTRRAPTTAPLAPDLKARLTALQKQRREEVAGIVDELIDRSNTTAKPDPGASPTTRDAHGLQSAFLAEHLGRPVTVFLLSGVKLSGKLMQFDQFTLLLQGPEGIDSLVFKHAVVTLQPGAWNGADTTRPGSQKQS